MLRPLTMMIATNLVALTGCGGVKVGGANVLESNVNGSLNAAFFVQQVTPTAVPGGSVITITGDGLGTEIVIRIDGQEVTPEGSSGRTQMQVRIPEGQPGVVTLSLAKGTAVSTFSILRLSAAGDPLYMGGLDRVCSDQEYYDIAGQKILGTRDCSGERHAGGKPQGGPVDQPPTGGAIPEGLADGSVTTPKLAGQAVTADKLAPGAVGPDHLAAGAVAADHLGFNVIGTDHLAAGAVSGDKIAAGSIQAGHLGDMACSENQVLKWVSGHWQCEDDKGLAGLAMISSADIVDGTVRDEDLAAGISPAKLGSGTAAIDISGRAATATTADNALSIQGQAVSATAPAADEILQFSGGAWTPAALQVSGGTGGTIADGTVTNADISTGADIDAAKIGTGDVSTAEFNHLNGVTSAIQTQLSNRLTLSGGTMGGAISMGGHPLNSVGNIAMASQKTLGLGVYTDTEEAVLKTGLGTSDAGKLWYNTTDGEQHYWDGSAVKVVGTGSVTSVNLGVPSEGLTVSGGPVTTSGTINLGLDDDLAALENMTGTGIAVRTGASTWSTIPDNTANWNTAYSNALKWDGLAVGDGTASAKSTAHTSLGLVIGTDVQAFDAGLASIAGLNTAANQMIYTTATDTYATTTVTAAGRALLDDADPAAQRTTLELGTMATQAASNVSITGGTITGVTLSSPTLANDAISGDKVDGGTISNFASTGIDDNATSTAVTIDASGEVGIGTNNPEFTLDINRAGNLDALRLRNTDTQGSSRIVFAEEFEDRNFEIKYYSKSDGSYNALEFWGKNASSVMNHHMSIQRNNGRVAIGTASEYTPTARLEVKGDGGERILDIHDGGSLAMSIGNNGHIGMGGLINPPHQISVSHSIGFRESGTSPSFYTSLRAGDQTEDVHYTLPPGRPTSDGQVLASTTGGVMSWATLGTMAAQAASSVNITGGTISGVDIDSPVFDDDGISGDKIHGGTISGFSSTGISDGASSTAIRINSGNKVGIGGSPDSSADLYVNGQLMTDSFKLTASAAAGKVLTSDTAGNGTWQTIATTSPTANEIPRADASGKIDSAWLPLATSSNPGVLKATSDRITLDTNGDITGLDATAIQGFAVDATAPGANKVLKFNGSSWSAMTDEIDGGDAAKLGGKTWDDPGDIGQTEAVPRLNVTYNRLMPTDTSPGCYYVDGADNNDGTIWVNKGTGTIMMCWGGGEKIIALTRHIIFTTSTKYDGDLTTGSGDITNIDQICRTRAAASASLQPIAQRFVALISYATSGGAVGSARGRFVPVHDVYNTNGQKFSTASAFWTATARTASAAYNEYGTAIPSEFYVWTATSSNGAYDGGGACTSTWTSSSFLNDARVGQANATGSAWIASGVNVACSDNTVRIYCISE